MQALKLVLKELDVKPDKDGAKTPWVLASHDGNKVKFKDIGVQEGLVPRVTGMGAKDAVYLLESYGLRVKMSGIGNVVSQSIPPGQKVVKGQTVAITLK
jgi:cell division protein FtsI (penicillin-binding protein 3)